MYSATMAPTCPVAPSADNAPLKIRSNFPYFSMLLASTLAVAMVSPPARHRSVMRQLSSQPRAIASLNAFSASVGPMVNTATLPPVCSFKTMAASMAFRSAGLIMPSELERIRAWVSGSTETSLETGTCFIRTAISIFSPLRRFLILTDAQTPSLPIMVSFLRA